MYYVLWMMDYGLWIVDDGLLFCMLLLHEFFYRTLHIHFNTGEMIATCLFKKKLLMLFQDGRSG